VDPQRLTIDELAELLHATPADLRKWLGDGLPWHTDNPRRRKFDAKQCFFRGTEVKEWLLARGYAEPPPERRILRSVREVANYYNVTPQRVYQWVDTGCPQELDKSFDLDAVEAWREARNAESAASTETAKAKAQHETDLARLKVEDAQIDLDRKKGNLIDRDTPTKIFARHIAEAKSHLKQIPGFTVSFMPEKATSAEKKRMQAEVQKKLDDVHSILEQGLREYANAVRSGKEVE
jgi:hypothetical protein